MKYKEKNLKKKIFIKKNCRFVIATILVMVKKI